MANGEHGEVICAGHGVVHERARQKLTGFFVVHAVLHERLANALHQTAMYLTFHNHGVDDGAEVVDCGELVDFGDTRFRINFDLADVSACRESEVGGVVEGGFVQAWLQLVQGVVVRHISG